MSARKAHARMPARRGTRASRTEESNGACNGALLSGIGLDHDRLLPVPVLVQEWQSTLRCVGADNGAHRGALSRAL